MSSFVMPFSGIGHWCVVLLKFLLTLLPPGKNPPDRNILLFTDFQGTAFFCARVLIILFSRSIRYRIPAAVFLYAKTHRLYRYYPEQVWFQQ